MATPSGGSAFTTVTARTILGPLDVPAGRADQIAQRLGDAIRRGVLEDGLRLPPEPELAQHLRVATVTLREALSMLRRQGLVSTRRGRGGGTFVRRPDAVVGHGLTEFTVLALRELGDHRRAIAGTAASLAAERALPEETDGLRRQLYRLRAALTARERGAADSQLAVAIAAAAQSARLTREELRLRAEVGELLWAGVNDRDHLHIVRRRTAIVDAIEAANARRARELAEAQVSAETERLIEQRLASYDGADPAGGAP
ncbi:MAG: FadR/GntR family transcriptional regulator [Jatrophihabitans sp.]|uniref:FadR/GntR family transcriptional regulator n=1 Tax=Jatrophihabitans sp. TaxID=1932789 RepID=UPI003F8162F0